MGKENFFPPFELKSWGLEKKQILEDERVNINVTTDSTTINNRKFGVLKVIWSYGDDVDKSITFATNLDEELIEFMFYTNLPNSENFFSDAITSMNTLEIEKGN